MFLDVFQNCLPDLFSLLVPILKSFLYIDPSYCDTDHVQISIAQVSYCHSLPSVRVHRKLFTFSTSSSISLMGF